MPHEDSNLSEEEQHQAAILEFLRAAGLLVDADITGLAGQTIPRDLLINQDKYDECKHKLVALKGWMSSSRLSCLQSTAVINQRWPLLNAVRQLLRIHNFKMSPFRLSDGYTKDGKKRIRRFFLVEQMKQTSVDDSDDGQPMGEDDEC